MEEKKDIDFSKDNDLHSNVANRLVSEMTIGELKELIRGEIGRYMTFVNTPWIHQDIPQTPNWVPPLWDNSSIKCSYDTNSIPRETPGQTNYTIPRDKEI